VGRALKTLAVHQQLNSEGGLAFLLERGVVVDIGYAIYYPGVTGADQIYDAVMAGGFNFIRELCGTGWLPSEVLFPHARPADAGHYRRLFNTALRFDTDTCALRFPAHWMEQSVEGADAASLRIAEKAAEVAGRTELVQRVHRALRRLLLSDKSSGDDVAQMLAMNRRTLNRRLQKQSTTFQEVLDEVRFEVARQLLADPRIAIDDIAATLGYASVSPFMRSFRRWTDTTPGRWRRTVGESAPVARQA
jgi:AraC-like DNA-binding protein